MGRGRAAATVVVALFALALPAPARAIDPIFASVDMSAGAFNGTTGDLDRIPDQEFDPAFDDDVEHDAGTGPQGSARSFASQATSFESDVDALTSLETEGVTEARKTQDGKATAQNDLVIRFEVEETKQMTLRGTLDATGARDGGPCNELGEVKVSVFGGDVDIFKQAACDGTNHVDVAVKARFNAGVRYNFELDSTAQVGESFGDDSNEETSDVSWDLSLTSGPFVPECGDVVIESVVLPDDLGPCPEDGLIVGASNITIDLGGHRISGDGGDNDAGIDNNAGHDLVKIRNGVIAHFGDGVETFGSNELTLTSLIVEENTFNGVFTDGEIGATIRNVRALNNGDDGLDLGCTVCLVENSRAEGNDNDGIHIVGGSENTLRANFASFNEGHGFFLEDSSFNKLKNNKASDNEKVGVVVKGSDNRLRENIASSNTLNGFQITGARNKLIENRAGLNLIAGVFLVGANENVLDANRLNGNEQQGLELIASSSNTIRNNIARGNKRQGFLILTGSSNNILTGNTVKNTLATVTGSGDGIAVASQSNDNMLKGNLSAQNGRFGIFVANDSNNTDLLGNTSKFNLVDGIRVDASSDLAVLNNNKALSNQNNGIFVSNPTATTTGRPNRASGNGAADCSTPPTVDCIT